VPLIQRACISICNRRQDSRRGKARIRPASKAIAPCADSVFVSVSIDRRSVPWVIRLDGVIDIGCAPELKAALLEGLTSGSAGQIDFEGATELDATAIQLLVAAEQAGRAAGMPWRLAGSCPETIVASLRDAGFERVPFTGGGQ
jgi:anti-anti-sigma regulatory factor